MPDEVITPGQVEDTESAPVEVYTTADLQALADDAASAAVTGATDELRGVASEVATDAVAATLAATSGDEAETTEVVGTVELDATQYAWLCDSLRVSNTLALLTSCLCCAVLFSLVVKPILDGWTLDG